MALFSSLAFIGNGLGTLAAGWVEANEKLQWRWIQWISMMLVSPSLDFMSIGLLSPFDIQNRRVLHSGVCFHDERD